MTDGVPRAINAEHGINLKTRKLMRKLRSEAIHHRCAAACRNSIG